MWNRNLEEADLRACRSRWLGSMCSACRLEIEMVAMLYAKQSQSTHIHFTADTRGWATAQQIQKCSQTFIPRCTFWFARMYFVHWAASGMKFPRIRAQPCTEQRGNLTAVFSYLTKEQPDECGICCGICLYIGLNVILSTNYTCSTSINIHIVRRMQPLNDCILFVWMFVFAFLYF